MKNWWRTDEELMKNWYRTDEELMKNWWRPDEELMKNWWKTDEQRTKDWWRTDDKLWRTDKELMKYWSSCHQVVKACFRSPKYCLEHSQTCTDGVLYLVFDIGLLIFYIWHNTGTILNNFHWFLRVILAIWKVLSVSRIMDLTDASACKNSERSSTNIIHVSTLIVCSRYYTNG